MSEESPRTEVTRLRAAVDSAPSGLLVIDADGLIVLVNREIERMFGYPRAELLGQTVELLVPHQVKSPHPGFRAEFFTNPQSRSMGAGRDLFGQRRDGTLVPVEIGLTPVETEDGPFVISAIVDISERRRAEARFRTAVESSPHGMVMVDATGRIVLVNREVERLFGYSREELLGRSIDLLVPARFRQGHPRDRERFFHAPQARAMGSGRELFGVRKDGSEVAVEIGLSPIETDEGLVVLGSIVDISARVATEANRRRLEDQLRHAQKMEAVGRLAGGVAHDFNNILGVIVGFAELVRDAGAASPSRSADLEEVLRAAQRGRELVQQILRFSRREELSRVPINLERTIPESLRLLRATLPASLDIRLHLAANLPQVVGDPNSLEQVVMNLATNAAHAMPSGGLLEISIEPFYARDSFVRAHPTLQEGPFVRLSVRDTGHGMDDATKAQAFEPFFTTKPAGSGTGLGLSMVHGIVHQFGGTVWLESQVGVGTTVSCLLPVNQEADPWGPDEVDIPRDEAGPRGHVLLVEDEPSLLTIGERRLTLAGYRVTAANDPTKALERYLAAPERFDLVVTDFSMPRLNGMELAQAIHRVRPELPVVLLTGYMQEFTPDELAAAGVRRVLTKPVTTQVLLDDI